MQELSVGKLKSLNDVDGAVDIDVVAPTSSARRARTCHTRSIYEAETRTEPVLTLSPFSVAMATSFGPRY